MTTIRLTVKEMNEQNKWKKKPIAKYDCPTYESGMAEFRDEVKKRIDSEQPVLVSLTEDGRVLATFQIK